ncbi:MAG: hypothetical protein RIQ54_394 [Candidatus Parcubacteria bacterium]|jgi:ATP-binding cassette subfamily B protein
MRLLFSYVKEYKGLLVLALFLATINQVFSLLDPQIFRILIDRYASNPGDFSGSDFLSGVLLLLGASMGTALISRIAKNFQDYYVNTIQMRVGARLYGHSVTHAFSLPYRVFEDQRSGELLQKLSKARTDAQQLINTAINVLFLSLVGIMFVIVYSFWVHWMIGVAYFLVIPILGSATFHIGKRLKTVQKSIVKETAELSGSATETLRNVELVKSLGLEGQEVGRLSGIIEKILHLELGKVRIVRALSFTQGTLINAMRTAIMFLMLYLIFQQEITLGEFFSLLFYSFALFNPLDALASVSTSYQETRASMNAIQELLDQKPDAPPARATTLTSLSSISFRNVGFSYEDTTRVLRGVSLSISSGETVALVGPSGGGKSTILKLLVGLYKPTEGAILINGIEHSAIDYEQFRRRIGYVAQDTQLFAGTIRENLQFVRPDATDAQCLDVLAKASALSIIEKHEQGLSAKIGEGGLKLSGGQRQRLAIARALLRDPELIIFDEATSSLDSLTEQEITDTIKQLRIVRPDVMMIMIAHRLSTIVHADRIYVLEKGTIIEEGSADHLISAGGLFGAMWRQQNPR